MSLGLFHRFRIPRVLDVMQLEKPDCLDYEEVRTATSIGKLEATVQTKDLTLNTAKSFNYYQGI